MQPLDGRWDDLVVLCSAISWDDVATVEKPLARCLADRVPILFVDPPTSPIRGGRLVPQLDRVEPNVALLRTAGLPAPSRPGVRALQRRLVERSIRRAVRALGSPSVRAIVSVNPPDLYDACPSMHRVALVTDDYAAGAELMGIDEAFLIDAERRQARRSDVVLTVSTALADKWAAMTGADVHVVPNGVDVDRYAHVDELTRPADLSLTGPMAVCMGHLNGRLDPKLLDAVADRGIPLLLIGPRTLSLDDPWFDRFVERTNVQWVGAKASDELPAYLGAADVGLVPYVLSDFNQASFPLKTLEYLAAGRGVVSTPLDAMKVIDSPLVTVSGGRDDYADLVEAELQRPRTPELVEARRSLARQHSWEARATQVADAIGLPTISEDPA